MHCETTEDAEGTWVHTWSVLEKKYAEGKIGSLGVSNFDIELLNSMREKVSILPHIVQNYASVGHIDHYVQEWCRVYGAVFQPYSNLRNIRDIPEDMEEVLGKIVNKHKRSLQQIILRFFLQLGKY